MVSTPASSHLEQHVADQAPVPGDRFEREDAGARHQRAVAAAIAAPEQLVAAAYGEECGPRLDGSAESSATGGEIGRDERLLAILPAADVDQVERRRVQLVTRLDSGHLEGMTAQRRAADEDCDVAAVGIDVEIVRIEVGDADPHGPSSQYGRARPRATAIARSSSIAV